MTMRIMQRVPVMQRQPAGLHAAAVPAVPRGVACRMAAKHLEQPTWATLVKDADMMCYQCEQTANNVFAGDGGGCTTLGVCGKTAEVAGLQDLLIYSLKGLGAMAAAARAGGIEDAEVDTFTNASIFATLTNVNFDDLRFHVYVEEAIRLHAKLAAALTAKGLPLPQPPTAPGTAWKGAMPHPLAWNAAQVGKAHTTEEFNEAAKKTGILERQEYLGNTLAGLQELLMYGMKGLAAYAHHAEALGANNTKVNAWVQDTMRFLASPEAASVDAVLAKCLECGDTNFTVMQMLSEAHSGKFGHPVPTPVQLHPSPGKAILVTGHDMHDLDMLLQQTAGLGINVYTHGEMLPGHGYPELKKHPHLKANFGGAWYKQKSDFAHFPGSVLVTTNCVMEPLPSYQANIFTSNEVGVKGGTHVHGLEGPAGWKDFSALIARAQQLPGFTEKECQEWPEKKTVTVGYGHNAVLNVAPQILDAVATGKLTHIFLVGGCDGHEPQRKYYANLGKNMPTDTMVLTLGCGKFRIFDQEFGDLPGTGLPRLLDMGQCNDAYSALVVATELSKALNTDINSLPLSLDLSWFEQKAVAVLLTMLNLGVKGIRLGPKLPAFLTPDAVAVLVKNFDLMPADTEHPENDLKQMMNKHNTAFAAAA